jgi:xylan 1,4-beta-xylosidase
LGKWGHNLEDFIATNNLPMTFFSSTWYGRVGEKQQGFEYNARTIRKKLEQYERLKTIPFEVAEFANLNDEFNRRLWNGDNTEWGASWYAGIAEKVYRLNVGQVHQWATTVFGIVQPRSHVHTMLGKMMGGDRLDVSVTEVHSSALSGAIAALRGDVIFVLIYNHHPLREPKLTENIRLNIYDSRMKQGEEWRLNEWLVDRDHGVFIYDFVKDCEAAELVPLPEGIKLSGDIQRCWGPAGVNILRRNFKRYAELARLAQTGSNDKIKVEDGRTTMNITMKGHSVRLLQLSR